MIDIITWLANNEKRIESIYRKAADYFHDDTDLKIFLDDLADDEALHFYIMDRAGDYYKGNAGYEAAVIIDSEIDERIKSILDGLNHHLAAGTLTRSFLCESIINAEFSEWNDIFLYVVESLKNDIDEFKNIGQAIQNHKYKVEVYYENRPEFKEITDKYKKLKPVWKDKILLVDDNLLIVELLASVLSKIGNIDKAYDGTEAFIKLQENRYKLIISDIDMPTMDGITFFEKSRDLYPDLNEFFLFFSSDISQERKNYFNEMNVGYMEKPEHLETIREKAVQILVKDRDIPLDFKQF